MHLKAVAKEISLCWDTPDMYLPASMADRPHSSWCWLPVYWRRAGTKPSTVNVLTRLWQLLVILARPKGGLFRYHVKRNRFTMQGFGFLSAILVRQNWKRATTTDGEVPPSFILATINAPLKISPRQQGTMDKLQHVQVSTSIIKR